MVRQPISADPDEDLVNSLTISTETVCYIIVRAHEFDVKDVDTELDTGASSYYDDGMASVLEDRGDDPVMEELARFISRLTVDDRADLVALAWLGRGDYGIEDWPALREEAGAAQGPDGRRTARYLLGMPVLGDYLQEGLSMFGKSCDSFEIDRR